MHDGMLCPVNRLEGLFQNMLSRLREHLYGYVLGNEPALNQRAAKLVFRFACRREADFNFLKSNLAKQLKKSAFFRTL